MENSSDDEYSNGDEHHHDDSDDCISYSGESDSDSEKEEIVASRGPYNNGTELFDAYIVFGNYFVLSHRRWNFLTKLVSKIKPDIPFYVCELTIQDEMSGKMYFSMEYSQNYLINYLPRERPVRVTHEYSEGSRQVKLSMESGRAVITRNWGYVVREADLLENEMVVFLFKERGQSLHLNMWSGIPTL